MRSVKNWSCNVDITHRSFASEAAEPDAKQTLFIQILALLHIIPQSQYLNIYVQTTRACTCYPHKTVVVCSSIIKVKSKSVHILLTHKHFKSFSGTFADLPDLLTGWKWSCPGLMSLGRWLGRRLTHVRLFS